MKLTRRNMLSGIAATGVLAGVMAGGGAALASTGSASPTATAASSTTATAVTAKSPAAKPPAAGRCAGMHPGMRAMRTAGKAAAGYLGLTPAQLRAKLHSGKSLADVARAEGKTVSGLKNAILAAITKQVDANTRLTATQKAHRISEAKDHLDAMVNRAHPLGRPGAARHGAARHGAAHASHPS